MDTSKSKQWIDDFTAALRTNGLVLPMDLIEMQPETLMDQIAELSITNFLKRQLAELGPRSAKA